MRLQFEPRLDYDFPESLASLLYLEAAYDDGQLVGAESLTFDPPIPWVRRDDAETGERRVAFTHQGRLKIAYDVEVEVLPADHSLASAVRHSVAALPVEILPYLRGSRFCESDRFERVAHREFPTVTGGDRVEAIIDWLRGHLDYRPGSSAGTTTAADTYLSRYGVCRDFAHLAIALCRASDIPARMVSVYALDLSRPDFHAVAEAYVGERWRLFDPSGLAAVDGMIRIGHGRDAADIAFLTIYGEAYMIEQSVTVRRL